MYGRPSKRMRRIKPVARVGAVDLNCRYDIHAHKMRKTAADTSDECFDVHEGEVVYKSNSGNFYRDNSLHVMSCTNGLDDTWKVAGVAVTGFSPRTDVYEQGFVIQVSGLTSIFNNSNATINAGENVYVVKAPNAPTPTGVPRSKQLLQLVTDTKEQELPADAQFLGTCAKGGSSKSTIDIVLHQCGPAKINANVAENLEEDKVGARFTRPAASVPKPRANKKSKSSK